MTESEPERIPYSPPEGIPAPITTTEALAQYAEALSAASGPIALDAERASGFRYSQRAYLIQVKREGAGTALIDPTAFESLTPLADVLADSEWILHAATQDLPCLAEAGLKPTHLFDTELAGRLLGHDRVNLAALVDHHLGHYLPKGHGATDWSQRPFTDEQLRYAALDVELLIPLRDSLHAQLVERGLWNAAQEEFHALVSFTPRDRGPDPWRRTSGMHKVRSPQSMAIVREMWRERDTLARATDKAPGRVLPDAALIAAASTPLDSADALMALPEFARARGAAKHRDVWWNAVTRARGLDPTDLPMSESRGLPAPRTWKDKNPPAASRLDAARAALAALAEQTGIPVENLLTPETLRQVCWNWTNPPEVQGIASVLAAGGARPWQCSLVSGPIAEAWAALDNSSRT